MPPYVNTAPTLQPSPANLGADRISWDETRKRLIAAGKQGYGQAFNPTDQQLLYFGSQYGRTAPEGASSAYAPDVKDIEGRLANAHDRLQWNQYFGINSAPNNPINPANPSPTVAPPPGANLNPTVGNAGANFVGGNPQVGTSGNLVGGNSQVGGPSAGASTNLIGGNPVVKTGPSPTVTEPPPTAGDQVKKGSYGLLKGSYGSQASF